MKTDALKRIQNEVAREMGLDHWMEERYDTRSIKFIPMINEISRRFALECCQATLAKASENADVMEHEDDYHKWPEQKRYVVDKETILDKENIVIL